MKTKVVLSAVLAVIVISGAALFLTRGGKNNPDSSTSNSPAPAAASRQPASSNGPAATAAPSSGSSTQSTGAAQSITVTANDTSASPGTIKVTKGSNVTLKFVVSSAGTYHGGLEFKSTDPALDSGSIAEGSSGTVTFTATKSFKFTPYWYESSVQKEYFVNVDVQ